MNAPMIQEPLTKLQCCPTSDGGAAAVLVSEAFLQARPELRSQAILIAGQAMATDNPSAFDRTAMNLVGAGITQRAVHDALAEAQVSIEDVKLIELHDCFSAAEMIFIDSLGVCPQGKAHEYVRAGDITFGGRTVINPSGGLLSKGHPLGATGLAQCAELVWQLRGWANNRIVENTHVALAHNLGLGGTGVVTIYRRADGADNQRVDDEEVKRMTGLTYNPAVKAGGFTVNQSNAVRSKKRSDWALGDTEKKVQARF